MNNLQNAEKARNLPVLAAKEAALTTAVADGAADFSTAEREAESAFAARLKGARPKRQTSAKPFF